MLTKLKVLDLDGTQVSDADCATLAAALNSGALLALERLAIFMWHPRQQPPGMRPWHVANRQPCAPDLYLTDGRACVVGAYQMNG